MNILALLILSAGLAVATPIPDSQANKIADAIYKAEGGAKTKYPYGIVSVKTTNPRQVCINTIKNTWTRYQSSPQTNDFIEFLGNRYCPVGVTNDPRGLNQNWVKNVKKFLDIK
jgi:hypothetical protein